MKLFEGIGKRRCDFGSRVVVQALGLDQPGTSGRIPERASKVPSGLSVGCARVFYVPGAAADATAGDRNHLVLAKPNVIMNDTRLRGLSVAGSEAAGRKSPHNHWSCGTKA